VTKPLTRTIGGLHCASPRRSWPTRSGSGQSAIPYCVLRGKKSWAVAC